MAHQLKKILALCGFQKATFCRLNDVENQLQNGNDHQILHRAAEEGDWEAAKPILMRNIGHACKRSIRVGQELLHVAVAATPRTAKTVSFVEELVKMLNPEDLEHKDDSQRTAFVYAVELGDVELAKIMVQKNDKLPIIYAYQENLIPLQVAILKNKENMVWYLYDLTPLQTLGELICSSLMEAAIQKDMYDVALRIFNDHHERIASSKLPTENSFLSVLIRKPPPLIEEKERGIWRKIVHATISSRKKKYLVRKNVKKLFEKICQVWLRLEDHKLTTLITSTEILHYAAQEGNAEFIAMLLSKRPALSLVLNKKSQTIFHVAVSFRHERVFNLVYNIGPFKRLVCQAVDEDGNNILHLAAILGQSVRDKDIEVHKLAKENVNCVRMSHGMIPIFQGESYEVWSIKMKTLLMSEDLWNVVENGYDDPDLFEERLKQNKKKDSKALFFIQQTIHPSMFSRIAKAITSKDAWEILKKESHQCSPKVKYNWEQPEIKVQETEKILPRRLLNVSGAALQLQQEILWFEVVKKVLPPRYCKMKNENSRTPEELFLMEHKTLISEGEKWMRDTANSCMIVATLIATVVFTAGFTVPGGYDQNTGIPMFVNHRRFTVFTIADSVAMVCSIMSIMMFLSILTSRYTKYDFRSALPAKLLLGLTALFVSVIGMLVAFTFAFFLIYLKKWEPKFIAAIAGSQFFLFLYLYWKLCYDMFKSIIGSKSLFGPSKLMVCSELELKNR